LQDKEIGPKAHEEFWDLP